MKLCTMYITSFTLIGSASCWKPPTANICGGLLDGKPLDKQHRGNRMTTSAVDASASQEIMKCNNEISIPVSIFLFTIIQI